MAKKAKGPQDKEQEKKPNFLVRTWKRLSGWCHDMKVEACLVVAACILIVGAFIWIFDAIAAGVIKALINLFKG